MKKCANATKIEDIEGKVKDQMEIKILCLKLLQ